MTQQPVEKGNPDYKIRLHKRFGKWVIDVTIHELGETIELHSETDYNRALGVFWFLQDNQHFMISEAKTRIMQRHTG